MKKYLLLTLVFLFSMTSAVAQIITEQSHKPIFFEVTSHNSNIKELPAKSFYDSKSDWQYIIDTTWGPGLPLEQKQQIFNAYRFKLEQKFDGFLSLGLTEQAWDTLVDYYYNKIDSSTSKGRFSAIMYYFAMNLRDGHTYAFDEEVAHTPLNPGVPVLVLGSLYQNEHFGAAVTVLEDSTALVLRAVENHPLNLEPGDIILGYEGVLWKDLVQELMEAELPAFGGREYFGGIAGSSSAIESGIHICVGMNWHLFNTIDILKYSTGEVVHLSVAPLLNLNLPPMFNFEQLEIPTIPFPNYSSGELVTYGILPNSNIGYMFVIAEWPTAPAEQQFYEAILALSNTDGLVIDMRFNGGGWALWQDAFGILANEVTYTLDDVLRCSPTNWLLCPENDSITYRIAGSPVDQYERPIAVLLGPACFSMGDVNAYRLRYLSTLKTFGRPTAANLGFNEYITNFPNWSIRYSIGDMYHLSQSGNYLNRKEFPIDHPVWFNTIDVANGYDTVVEEALEWINNLVYGHDVTISQNYLIPGTDTLNISTIIENPNSHQISVRCYIHNLNNVLIDSLDLIQQIVSEDEENWIGSYPAPTMEDYFKISVTVFDQTISDKFTLSNATRFSTVGPETLDSLYVVDNATYITVKPFIKNNSSVQSITEAQIKLICNDPWITSISPATLDLPDIPPGAIVSTTNSFTVNIDTSVFQNYFNFKTEVMSGGWLYWIDSMRVPPIAVISIYPTELNFGEISIDSSTIKTFNISNYGNEDLIISDISSSEPVFTVNLTSAVIHPDSSQQIEVTFTPTTLQTYSGVIEIIHSAEGSPDTVIVIGDGVTGVEEEIQPLTYSLEQNYPNPFNPVTTIKYSIPELSEVILKMYNLLGEEVAVLVSESKRAGNYEVELDATELTSGIYFYRLQAGVFVETKKMVLMK